ncbi:hypothetical protein Dsin_030180 [Dipteronia sinensis]|uniref:Uncharacterized protein n=1 Tax=Dipteronia sinensis TaxID=43782 RepID=A0AAD9ZKL1_9ROSI|nr:hypothetical protein Dsin_030180 [Dipteronia sinensis]
MQLTGGGHASPKIDNNPCGARRDRPRRLRFRFLRLAQEETQRNVFETSRVGDINRLRFLLNSGLVNVKAHDYWDSVALYYACLSGHLDATRMLLKNGANCYEHTFDDDMYQYFTLNLKVVIAAGAVEATLRDILS